MHLQTLDIRIQHTKTHYTAFHRVLLPLDHPGDSHARCAHPEDLQGQFQADLLQDMTVDVAPLATDHHRTSDLGLREAVLDKAKVSTAHFQQSRLAETPEIPETQETQETRETAVPHPEV
ncbi:hypothetical protein N7528_000358 [Penicillium herquei]|nr:hypothetical protein N7528_000358 [Penicillium herquei]